MHRSNHVTLEEERQLFSEYQGNPTLVNRNKIVERYLFVVDRAVRYAKSTMPKFVTEEEIRGACEIELTKAPERFDTTRGIRFHNFVFTRLKGASIDHLRNFEHWFGRTYSRLRGVIEKSRDDFRKDFGREASVEELQDRLRKLMEHKHPLIRSNHVVDVSKPYGINSVCRTFSDYHQITGSNGSDLEEQVITKDTTDHGIMREEIQELLNSHLTKQELRIIDLYFVKNKTLDQVGETIGLSGSRICQLLGDIKNSIRKEPKLEEKLREIAVELGVI